MNDNNVLSFPVSSPIRGNWKRGGNESGNGLVKVAISNGKSGNEQETGFRPSLETRGPQIGVSFPNLPVHEKTADSLISVPLGKTMRRRTPRRSSGGAKEKLTKKDEE